MDTKDYFMVLGKYGYAPFILESKEVLVRVQNINNPSKFVIFNLLGGVINCSSSMKPNKVIALSKVVVRNQQLLQRGVRF